LVLERYYQDEEKEQAEGPLKLVPYAEFEQAAEQGGDDDEPSVTDPLRWNFDN